MCLFGHAPICDGPTSSLTGAPLCGMECGERVSALVNSLWLSIPSLPPPNMFWKENGSPIPALLVSDSSMKIADNAKIRNTTPLIRVTKQN